MTQQFFIDSNGKYLGSFDGPNGGYWNGTEWGSPPSGATTVATPPPSVDSTYTNGAWVPGQMAVAATAQAQLESVLRAGIAVTSTGTSALDATYALDSTSQSELYQIASYAQNFGVFPNGQSTMAYPDVTGTPHTFTSTQIINLLKVVAPYVTACQVVEETLAAGGSASYPPGSATIA